MKYGEPSSSPPPHILPLAIHHRHQRADQCRHNRRRNDLSRVHTPVLAPVSNHIHRYQLQRRNIQNQKCTHLITSNALPLSSHFFPIIQISHRPPLRLQLRQFLHRLQPPLCQVNDTKFFVILKTGIY